MQCSFVCLSDPPKFTPNCLDLWDTDLKSFSFLQLQMHPFVTTCFQPCTPTSSVATFFPTCTSSLKITGSFTYTVYPDQTNQNQQTKHLPTISPKDSNHPPSLPGTFSHPGDALLSSPNKHITPFHRWKTRTEPWTDVDFISPALKPVASRFHLELSATWHLHAKRSQALRQEGDLRFLSQVGLPGWLFKKVSVS